MQRVDAGALGGPSWRRVSRRSFLQLCAALTAVLALPPIYAERVAAAVAAAPRLPVIWLRGQGCGGDTEAFLRAADPSIAALLFDLLAVEYHPALMAASGAAAESDLDAALRRHPGGYFAVVEGAVPRSEDGAYLTVGGRPFADRVREVGAGALATIAVGSCAFDGGLAGAAGGSSGATGVAGLVPADRLIALPGCPVNVENLTATIVHYLTFGALPPTDGRGRPLFAYGPLIHNECGRRAHFEFGEFVETWGDEGAQKGWCLYKMGCKGPQSFANCASVRYASGTSWPVRAGAACIACTMPGFWDAMSPFSRRLPSPIPFAPDVTVPQAGLALVAGVGAFVAAHGVASVARAGARRARGGKSADVAAVNEPVSADVAGGAPAPEAAPGPSPEPSAVVAIAEEPAADEEPTAPEGPSGSVESEPALEGPAGSVQSALAPESGEPTDVTQDETSSSAKPPSVEDA